jgi:hypothetical protein
MYADPAAWFLVEGSDVKLGVAYLCTVYAGELPPCT